MTFWRVVFWLGYAGFLLVWLSFDPFYRDEVTRHDKKRRPK